MKLDIIIPVLNEAGNLSRLLPYLNQESNGNCTIIVVDANSTKDNTKSVCEQYGVTYLNSTITRRSAQLDKGASFGTGTMLMFVHADVIPPKGFISLIAESVAKGNKAGLFCYEFRPTTLMLSINAWFTRYETLFCGGGDQCLFISRVQYMILGGFDPEHRIMEDFELFKKIKLNMVPYELIQTSAIVSSRKYEDYSWFRVNLVQLITIGLFWINRPNEKIYEFYKKHLK